MPSHPDPSNEQTSEGKDLSELLRQYQNLSKKYDEVVKISEQILNELKGQKEETELSRLLDQKWEIGKKIELLSRSIAGSNIQGSSSQKHILDQVRLEITEIESKAEKLWSLERRIRELTENK